MRKHSSHTQCIFLLPLSLDVEATLEVRALINGDALGRDVARHNSRLFQVNPVTRLNIAFQFALHDHGTGSDVGFDATIRSDGQTVSFRVDSTFHLAINIKVFAARQLPFNHYRRADESCFPSGSIRRFGRFHAPLIREDLR